jgi:hypothetical protein
MRLQITFPDLTFNDKGTSTDEGSDNKLSLYLHNSYDGSEGVRMFWGAIRSICTNGMVFGSLLDKFYGRHTKNIQLGNIRGKIMKTYDKIPEIQSRIKVLEELDSREEKLLKGIKTEMGKTVSDMVGNSPDMSQWALYNVLTQYISHKVDVQRRSVYQQKVSKLFNL